MQDNIAEKCRKARECAPYMAALSTYHKNYMISVISTALTAFESDILAANEKDLAACSGKPDYFLDRLKLSRERIKDLGESIKKLLVLPDPIGDIVDEWNTVGTDLYIRKVRTPLGVLGLIYEARPNVTVDSVCLAIKTGNAIVLRGSKDAINTNKMLVDVIRAELKRNGYKQDAVQLIEDVTHEGANFFMQQRDYVDVLIPRGSKEFIKKVVATASIPVIETGAGNCHAYIEKSADLDMAEKIVLNGKLSRPSVCNALESLLIDQDIAESSLPRLIGALKEKGVEVRGCEATRRIWPDAQPAAEDDFYREYNALIISVKVVKNTREAIEHINNYSTHHSDVIVTNDTAAAEEFLNNVDSAAVYVNASTRFTDGFEFGFGAEMGVSTQKLHARGPLGLEELTSYKYQIRGKGQIRK